MRVLIRKWLLATSVVFGALILTQGVAHAAGAEVVQSSANHVITVPMLLITLISGTVIPIVHGFVTKLGASNPVNVIVGLLLSAIAGVVGTATALDGVAVFSETTLIQAFLAWLSQVAIYARVWKPMGVYDKLAPNVGIG